MECYAHYSIEKFIGNKKDSEAPPAGKMRIEALGMGGNVVFADGSKVKNHENAVFNSPYIKSKIKEFNDYYINQKGYQPFTQEDYRKLRMDVDQILRKLCHLYDTKKIGFKFIGGTAIYGLFDNGLVGYHKHKNIDRAIPYCIAYTHINEKGEKRVIVRRLVVAGIYSKNITENHAKWGSGGKEIGTVKS